VPALVCERPENSPSSLSPNDTLLASLTSAPADSSAGQPWTLEANGPVIRDTIAIFGIDRCMFASNYPVDRLAGTFDEIYSGFFASVAGKSRADQLKLFHDNAVRLYRL
jgi:predicted TIM-barrel fold metal-dependent hydrolase